MGSQRPGEDWSEDDLGMLLELHLSRRVLALPSGWLSAAALVMLAAAFESVLLGAVIAHEETLQADNQWSAEPSKMHLWQLAERARERGWLTDPATEQVVEILNKARTMAAHPGAYVRGIRQALDHDLRAPDGYDVCHRIVVDACQQLFAADKRESGAIQSQPEAISLQEQSDS